MRIACIVEGFGEVESVPIIVRRITQAIAPSRHVEVLHPIRIPKAKLLKPGELERAIRLAAMKLEGQGRVLVLLDADDECPAESAPALKARASVGAQGIGLSVVLPKYELEAWFLSALLSLRGIRGIATTVKSPADPEGIRNAKGWLRSQMTGSRSYSETLDQPALAAQFDLNQARAASSFDKLYRDLEAFLASTED